MVCEICLLRDEGRRLIVGTTWRFRLTAPDPDGAHKVLEFPHGPEKMPQASNYVYYCERNKASQQSCAENPWTTAGYPTGHWKLIPFLSIRPNAACHPRMWTKIKICI